VTFTLGTMVAPPGVESPAALRDAVADGALHGLWWPDHWMGWAPAAAWSAAGPIADAWPSPDLYADPFVEMVAIGATVRPPLVGTAVTDVVRRHPAGLVQSAESVLRALPGTRLALGIGAGERANLEPYGLARGSLGLVAETLDALRAMRNDGVATMAGRHLTLDRAPTPAPLCRDRLSVWLGAHGPRMRALAASAADGWLPVGFTPRQIAAVVAELDRPSGWTVGVCVPIGIVESAAERDRMCASPALKMLALSWDPAVFRRVGATHPLGDTVDPLRDLVAGHLTRSDALALLDRVPDEVVARFIRWGTPAGTAALFADYRSAGVDHLVAWEITHLADPTRRARSIELLRRAWAGLPPRLASVLSFSGPENDNTDA